MIDFLLWLWLFAAGSWDKTGRFCAKRLQKWPVSLHFTFAKNRQNSGSWPKPVGVFPKPPLVDAAERQNEFAGFGPEANFAAVAAKRKNSAGRCCSLQPNDANLGMA